MTSSYLLVSLIAQQNFLNRSRETSNSTLLETIVQEWDGELIGRGAFTNLKMCFSKLDT